VTDYEAAAPLATQLAECTPFWMRIFASGETWAPDRVVAAWRAGAGDVVAASYGGSRGHPVVLGRSAWASVPDEGARALQPVLVPCDDLDPPGDVDRPEDLPERLR